MTMKSVKIGPEFFSKAFLDYADWKWAIVREFMQNSIDCGSRRIEITTSQLEPNRMQLVVSNDGDSMSEEILTEKLLSLGSSGKNFAGSVGGFGKAKEVLYFAHESYKIRTGGHLVSGSGATYEIKKTKDFLKGTTSTITMRCDEKSIIDQFVKFVSLSQWSGTLVVNGNEITDRLSKGTYRRDLSFSKVYTNKSYSNVIVVRVNGTPMYTNYTRFDRCVVIELVGKSSQMLTSNRDGIRSKFQGELNEFILDLTTNKSKALRNRSVRKYHLFSGNKLQVATKDQTKTEAGFAAALVATDSEVEVKDLENETSSEQGNSSIQKMVGTLTMDSVKSEHVQGSDSCFSNAFLVKNETDLEIPSHFLPNNAGNYSKKIGSMWTNLMIQLHKIFNHGSEFMVGFIFSEDAEAQYEHGTYGDVYLVNPAKVVTQVFSTSRSFKKRFSLTERNRLLSLAVHEFVHGLGYSDHDEAYASKLTDAMALVMDYRKDFNWCFSV